MYVETLYIPVRITVSSLVFQRDVLPNCSLAPSLVKPMVECSVSGLTCHGGSSAVSKSSKDRAMDIESPGGQRTGAREKDLWCRKSWWLGPMEQASMIGKGFGVKPQGLKIRLEIDLGMFPAAVFGAVVHLRDLIAWVTKPLRVFPVFPSPG
jgi:hypothetical protein